MKKRMAGGIVAGVAIAAALTGGAAAMASGSDQEGRASGPAADQASAAAVKQTGGTVNAVERDDENGATWEVEVTRPDGSIADVRLDANYKVIVVEADSESTTFGTGARTPRSAPRRVPENSPSDARGGVPVMTSPDLFVAAAVERVRGLSFRHSCLGVAPSRPYRRSAAPEARAGQDRVGADEQVRVREGGGCRRAFETAGLRSRS